MKYFLHLLLFLVVNFGALAIGTVFTTPGVNSEWYAALHKAPWTPPGFVFGLAWSTIMLCFSFYMANIWKSEGLTGTIITMYVAETILNISWNPLFFHFHLTAVALAIITALLLVVIWFMMRGFKTSKLQGILMLPYFIWLLIATSLNGYICFMN
jgi:benzodiazapine receptor